MIEELEIDDDGNVAKFKSTLDFFHPVRHIPPTNATDDMNISPVEGYTFAVCRSMQNIQVLTGAGGCSKYVLKYISKIDEQNYVVVSVEGQGKITTRANYLHNTKVTSSKIGKQTIDSYIYAYIHNRFTKHFIIRGFPGASKTWCMEYLSIYAMSKGLKSITTAMMAKQAIQLGSKHWHKIFCIPPERNISSYRKAELALIRLLKNPDLLEIVSTTNIFFVMSSVKYQRIFYLSLI